MRFRFAVMLVSVSPLITFVGWGDTTRSRAPLSLCRIERGGGASGISADICAQTSQRWSALMGTEPSPGEIRLVADGSTHSTDTPASWLLEWPAPGPGSSVVRRRAHDGLSPHEAVNILTHEAGHHLFNVDFGSLNVGWDGKRYGTLAPDWIDEAVAVWMESSGFRAQRVRALARTNPSLATLVTMDHPQRRAVSDNLNDASFRRHERVVTPPCRICTFLPESVRTRYRVQDIGVNARGRPDTIVWYSDTDPNNSGSVEQREFYPLSYSLLRFIRTRGGAAAVRELIARYRENPKPRVEVLAGLPGMPASLKAVESAWQSFLKHPPPEED